MSLSEARWQVLQFLATQYPADLEGSQAPAPEEVARINFLNGDLEGKADWDIRDLTEGPNLGSQASIGGDYSRLCEACSMFNESIPSTAVALLSLIIRSVGAMSKTFILEVPVGALK